MVLYAVRFSPMEGREPGQLFDILEVATVNEKCKDNNCTSSRPYMMSYMTSKGIKTAFKFMRALFRCTGLREGSYSTTLTVPVNPKDGDYIIESEVYYESLEDFLSAHPSVATDLVISSL